MLTWCQLRLIPPMREVTVLRILGSRTRCHAISIHLLFVASTVQGIAPDRHSLISLKALHVLCSIQVFSEFAGGEDDAPEEEIEATEATDGLVSRLLVARMKNAAGLTVRVIEPDPLRFCCPRGNLPTPDRLSINLCRLTC
jgi:hypothetical protein